MITYGWDNSSAEDRAKQGCVSRWALDCSTVLLHWLFCHHLSIPYFHPPSFTLSESLLIFCSPVTTSYSLHFSPSVPFPVRFHYLFTLFTHVFPFPLLVLIYIDLCLFLFILTTDPGLSNYISILYSFQTVFLFATLWQIIMSPVS